MVFYHQGGTIRIVYGDHVVEDPMSTWPKLIARTVIPVSQWLSVISRDVQFSPQGDVETYYAIEQPDYLVGVAVTPGERILLVRQYRPALEKFSLELPAGLLEENEDPATAMARELLEETGYATESIKLIGKTATCSSRISNHTYSFFIRAGSRVREFIEEPGISVSSASPGELRELIRTGEFSEQTHLGALTLTIAGGLLAL
jgi:ADP-ribose pyrophosphatase